MEPRDDFDRAGASLRVRAAGLARDHDADEVVRLARRRRGWQGAVTAVATILVVVGILNGVAEQPVDRIAIEPLGPSEPAPATPPSEPTLREEPADSAPLPCKDGAAFTDAATIGTISSPTPIDLAGEPLAVVGDELFALSSHATPWFGAWSADGGWRCLPWPDLDAPRMTIGGHDHLLLALARDEAAVFDRDAGRWRSPPAPPTSEPPLAGTWTGREFLVVLTAAGPGEGNRVIAYDPITDSWDELPRLPVAVNRVHAASVLTSTVGTVVVGSYMTEGETADSLSALTYDGAEGWRQFPPPPLAATGNAAVVGAKVHVVGAGHDHAWLDLTTGVWSEPQPTGLDGGCLPAVVATESYLVAADCGSVAVSDLDGGAWRPLHVGVDTSSALVSLPNDRVATWVDGPGGAVGLLTFSPSDAGVNAATAAQCAAISSFAASMADAGSTADEAAVTPADLAGEVDLVATGALTGEVEVANGPGPAGESYVAYELAVTEVVTGDVIVGDTVRVSIAFDGDPTRSAALTTDVPAGASVMVFAYEVTDAPGGWVAADGNGFAVACDGGPPLGQVGDGPAWSELADIDALVDAARP